MLDFIREFIPEFEDPIKGATLYFSQTRKV